MKQYTTFAVTENQAVPIDVYGYCKTKTQAIGNLIEGLHDSVAISYPNQCGQGDLDIEMSGINYFPDGLQIKMIVREKGSYAQLCTLIGYAIEVYEATEEDE